MQLVRLLLAAALLAASPAWALHKCTDAAGKVTYQSTPCGNDFADDKALKINRQQNVVGSRAPREARAEVRPNTAIEGPAAAAPLLALYRRWADADRLAGSTARIALAGPTAELQAIKRDIEALQVPACLSDPKATLDELAGKSVEAILRFAMKEEVTSMVYTIVERPDLIKKFEKEIDLARCE